VVIDKPGYGTEIPDEKSPPSPLRHVLDSNPLNAVYGLLNEFEMPLGFGW